MPEPIQHRRYRFGAFEADAATGELRRQGLRVRLHDQPFALLLLLLERAGELVTREEIAASLWPTGTFVDFERGVNSAVNRLRNALNDTAASPRFIETLARKGYRFVAPVEQIGNDAAPPPADPEHNAGEQRTATHILAAPEDLPAAPRPLVQTLYILLQAMYLAFYIGALANLAEIDGLLRPLRFAAFVFNLLVVAAAVLIPVRAFTLCAALFYAPGFRRQFLRLWPFLLVADVLWALSPFLLLNHIDVGLAMASMAFLVYSPFAQRSLVLMGAGVRAKK
jgi:DNA-binding winged helix-turn-helix (wHTH) protein